MGRKVPLYRRMRLTLVRKPESGDHYGCAREVRSVLPELVHENSDGCFLWSTLRGADLVEAKRSEEMDAMKATVEALAKSSQVAAEYRRDDEGRARIVADGSKERKGD